MFRRFPIVACVSLAAAVWPVRAQISPVKAPPIGQVQNGVYHHNRTGIEFAVPADWVLVSQGFATGGAQTVFLRDSASNVVALAWMKARPMDPANIPALMERRLDTRLAQRNNFEGYKYRPDSLQRTTIGGKPALSVAADYTSAGQAMVECITWVDGETSRVAFTARMPAAAYPAFASRFDAIIQSAIVP